MTTGGFSPKQLARVRDVLERNVDSGFVPGAVAVVARHGEVHIEATGTLAFEGAGSGTPMAADTICRIASTTKPIVAACAMTLVEDCMLRLDDPVDEFLPELADMRVLADPGGPLEETVPANRPVTLRDLLAFTLGTGIVGAEPATSPIADALNALQSDEPSARDRSLLAGAEGIEQPPDEWIRRLGTLPLVYQPGERWMYNTAANVTGVLIARATGMSFGDALRERICEPLGMKDTGFSVASQSISRLATALPSATRSPARSPSQTAPMGTGAGRRRSKTAAAGSSRPSAITSPSPRRCSPAVPITASGCSRGRR